jgi:hypothetical protein
MTRWRGRTFYEMRCRIASRSLRGCERKLKHD